MARKKVMPKDRLCPILTIAGTAEVKCYGEDCALFKGEETRFDGECAISDISGWLRNMAELAATASAGQQTAPTEEPEDEKAGPTDPEEEEPENK
jgi:hypothetical protein